MHLSFHYQQYCEEVVVVAQNLCPGSVCVLVYREVAAAALCTRKDIGWTNTHTYTCIYAYINYHNDTRPNRTLYNRPVCIFIIQNVIESQPSALLAIANPLANHTHINRPSID